MRTTKILQTTLLILIIGLAPSCASPKVETPVPTKTTAAQTTEPNPSVNPSPTPEPADIIFYNGNIITMERSAPLAQAVAIHDGLIQAAGPDKEVLANQGEETALIDLQGNTLMPGFVEGHTHYTRRSWEDGIPLETTMQNMLAFGLTSITEMSSTDEYLDMILEAERNGNVHVHLNIFAKYNCSYLEDGKSVECISWYREHDPILDPTRMVRIPGVKIFVDGAGTPSRGCTYHSYLWPENITELWPDIWETCGTPHGDLYLTEEQLTGVLQDIQERGYRAAFHAMGDAAIEITMNAIETVLDGQPNSQVRHQIQHNSVIRPDMLERYEELDILASVRGAFNTCEADWYEAAFGEEVYAWNANRFELANMDIHAYSEGDFSNGDIFDITRANPLNPVRSLYGLVTHQQVRSDGSVCEPPEWIASHHISVERALEMLTIEPAYAVSLEDHIGSIRPGKYADLIILSEDPLTIDPNRLGDLTVRMTMVNGETKYCAPGQEEFCPQPIEFEIETPPTQTEPPRFTQVKFNCDEMGESPAHAGKEEYVQTTIRWAAVTEEQVQDYLEAVSASILVNGSPVDSTATHGEVRPLEGRDLFFTTSFFDVGVLGPGEHVIRTVLAFSEVIYDGFNHYGPGTENPAMEGTCTVIVE